MFKNKSGRIYIILMLSLLLISVVLGYFMARATASPLKEEDSEKLLQDCVITHKYNFLMCGSSFTKNENIDRSYIGLTKEQLQDYITDGRITEFSCEKVIITHDIRQYCDKHYILTLDDEELVIMQNLSASSKMDIICNMGAPVTLLKSSVRKRLTNGIVFNGLNEAKEYALKDIYN